jgi:uncharacterized membrane protein
LLSLLLDRLHFPQQLLLRILGLLGLLLCARCGIAANLLLQQQQQQQQQQQKQCSDRKARAPLTNCYPPSPVTS